MAQFQGRCPECGRKLVNKRLSSVDKLTVHHNGEYDHVRRRARGECKGGVLMHAACHKRKHMRDNRVWEKREQFKKLLGDFVEAKKEETNEAIR